MHASLVFVSLFALASGCGGGNGFSGAAGHKAAAKKAVAGKADPAQTPGAGRTSPSLEGLSLADFGPVVDLGTLWTGTGFFVEDRAWKSPSGFHFPTFMQDSMTLSDSWLRQAIYIFPTTTTNAAGQNVNNVGRATFSPEMEVQPRGEVLISAPDTNYESFPGVWKDDDGTWLMVFERGLIGGDSEIGLASSSDGGVTWTKHAGPFFKRDPSNAATRCGIGTPSIYKVNGTWYLFFHGFDCHDVQIFLSTAQNLGGPWTPANNGGPVVPTGPDAFDPAHDAPVDSGTTGRRGIVKQGDLYYMVFEVSEDLNYCMDRDTKVPCANPNFGGVNWSSALARSQDLVHWDRNPSGVRGLILPPTYKNFGQDGATFGPGPGGRTFVYYRVGDNSTRRAAVVSYDGAVQAVFRHFLGRDATAGDVDHYKTALHDGKMSFDSFVAEVSGSNEAQAKGAPADPLSFGPVAVANPQAAPPPPPATPPARSWSELARQLYFPGWGTHLFTSHLDECTGGCNMMGDWFRALAVDPEAHDSCANGNVRTLYGAAILAGDRWLFNLDAWDGGHAALTANGWNTRGPAFNVLCQQEPGTLPLYKHINAQTGDRFYNLDGSTPQGYSTIGVIGYVLAPDAPIPAPPSPPETQSDPAPAPTAPAPVTTQAPPPPPPPPPPPSPDQIARAHAVAFWGANDNHGWNLYSATPAELNGRDHLSVVFRAPIDCNGFDHMAIFRAHFDQPGLGPVFDFDADGPQGGLLQHGWQRDGFVFCTVAQTYPGVVPLYKYVDAAYGNRVYSTDPNVHLSNYSGPITVGFVYPP